MGHDWLFEVLADMKTYAERHGMSALAAKIAETEEVARHEVATAGQPDDDSADGSRDKPARRR